MSIKIILFKIFVCGPLLIGGIPLSILIIFPISLSLHRLDYIRTNKILQLYKIILTRMTTSISSEAFEKKAQKVKESKIMQWTKKITNKEISPLLLLLS